MALLQMVNAVRGKLREERIATISSSDLLTTEVIGLINDAGSEILEGNDWEFDVRHDGKLWFPSSQSGTQAAPGGSLGGTLYSNVTSAAWSILTLADDDAGEVFEDIDLAGFRMSGNRVRSKIITLGTDVPNTSWIISTVNLQLSGITLSLTVKNDGLFTPATSYQSLTTYGNEVVLPTNVKDVLSVRNEEDPIRLEFIDRNIHFDRYVPRAIDSFSNTPEVVTVGGTITSTARTSEASWTTISDEAAVTGTGCMVWPIPSEDLHLDYSFRIQHSDLSANTDVWEGVPDNINRIIELRAFQSALESGIQNDPDLARSIERQVEKRTLRALMKQSRQPNRRRVPSTFGYQGGYNSRRRWSSQTISAP